MGLNIPKKKAGDKLFAEEINKLVQTVDSNTEKIEHGLHRTVVESTEDGNTVQLQDSIGNNEYPSTLASAVQMRNGGNVDQAVGKLQSQMSSLLAGNVKFGFSASPSLMFVGETKNVNLAANITNGTGQITIQKSEGESWQSGEAAASFSHEDSVTAVAGVSATYTAATEVYGKVFSATAKVTGVYPIYAGAATSYTEIGTETYKVKTPKTSLNGDYSISAKAGQKVYFLAPSTMNVALDSFYLGKLQMPMKQAQTMQLNGTEYKVYESANAVIETIVLKIKIG